MHWSVARILLARTSDSGRVSETRIEVPISKVGEFNMGLSGEGVATRLKICGCSACRLDGCAGSRCCLWLTSSPMIDVSAVFGCGVHLFRTQPMSRKTSLPKLVAMLERTTGLISAFRSCGASSSPEGWCRGLWRKFLIRSNCITWKACRNNPRILSFIFSKKRTKQFGERVGFALHQDGRQWRRRQRCVITVLRR